jgi:hypothetical protein
MRCYQQIVMAKAGCRKPTLQTDGPQHSFSKISKKLCYFRVPAKHLRCIFSTAFYIACYSKTALGRIQQKRLPVSTGNLPKNYWRID